MKPSKGDPSSYEHNILNLLVMLPGSEAVAEARGYRPAFIHGISNRCRGLIARGVHGQRVKKVKM